MSTKFTQKQIKIVQKALKEASRKYKRALKRRITKQIRVSLDAHNSIKQMAKERKMTMSKLLDERLK